MSSSSLACDGFRRVSSSSSDDAKEKEEEGEAIRQKKTKTTEREKEDQDRVSPDPDPEEDPPDATAAEALLQSQLGAMALTPGPSQQHQVPGARWVRRNHYKSMNSPHGPLWWSVLATPF